MGHCLPINAELPLNVDTWSSGRGPNTFWITDLKMILHETYAIGAYIVPMTIALQLVNIIFARKQWLPSDELGHDATDCPGINLRRILDRPYEEFRCAIPSRRHIIGKWSIVIVMVGTDSTGKP